MFLSRASACASSRHVACLAATRTRQGSVSRFLSSNTSLHKKALRVLGRPQPNPWGGVNGAVESLTKENKKESDADRRIQDTGSTTKHDSRCTAKPTFLKLNDDVPVESIGERSMTHESVVPPSKVDFAPTTSTPSTAPKLDFEPRTTLHSAPSLHEFAPKILVAGVGGAGSNALNNMISKDLQGVDFLALNTDAQHLSTCLTDQRLQLGLDLTRGLGCGANPDAGRMAAEECKDAILESVKDAHMVFITAGMGGGTGTGAAPVVAELCYQLGILTVAVVTLPFSFEGTHRRRLAQEGIERLTPVVDTLITIPNQNLMSLANDQTSFVEAFRMADDVLLGGVGSITSLMTSPGLINLDFADVQSVMHGMGNALLGTGVSSGDDRAVEAANMALDNPLLGSDMDISSAKGMLVNITGGKDMTLFEVDKAAQCITEQVLDESANIIFGSAYDEALEGSVRVSVVATGIGMKE